MFSTEISLKKPSSGDYSTSFYQNEYSPNNYLSFTIGKIIYIPQIKENENEQNKTNTNEMKSIPTVIDIIEIPKQMINFPSQNAVMRQPTDRTMKGMCLYLYYLLFLIDSNSEISFHSGCKQFPSDLDILKNFHCGYIISNGNEIFNEKEIYMIEKDEVSKIPTIKMNIETNIPIIDYRKCRRYTENQSIRAQQHILIHIINNLLCEHNLHLDFIVKKSAPSFISSIQFDSYIDKNNDNNLIQREIQSKNNVEEKNDFDKLIDSLFIFFIYSMDNVYGLTKKMIIGNISCQPNDIFKKDDCIFIGIDKFLEMIQELRTSNKTIQELFHQFI